MLVILAHFLRFLKGTHFGKLPAESERSDRLLSGKFLKIIEHVSYLIKCCKISLLIYSGSSSLSNVGRFFLTHPVVFDKIEKKNEMSDSLVNIFFEKCITMRTL